jgi:hypothetical protein
MAVTRSLVTEVEPMLSRELVHAIEHDRRREIERALRVRELREAVAESRAAAECEERALARLAPSRRGQATEAGA